jgi:diacylglycerol kinase family enzyme
MLPRVYRHGDHIPDPNIHEMRAKIRVAVEADRPLPIVADGVVEVDETFTVTLSSPTGVTLGAPSTMTVTISDPDPFPAGGVLPAGSS